ncbi:E3 ubiquitin-protein ligase XIAP-like [Ylistrum balloti]|uniref:E3 ubiquitin-protein ligase XIAP-like n=1 Tax=Ylistrum balloti TaxID=509963 RepID=UPI0029059E6D|nr:E3 ubiquitin-protein ligase XIAP-like [Ylistrum balloti]
MACRKSPVWIFLVCSALISGYIIGCDSLKSNKRIPDHDPEWTNVTSTIARVCIQHVGFGVLSDGETFLLIQAGNVSGQCYVVVLYKYLSGLFRRHTNFDFSLKIQKTKLNQDSNNVESENKNGLDWINGKRIMNYRPGQSPDEITNHLFAANRTLHSVEAPYHTFNHGKLELKTDLKLSIILLCILTRIVLMVYPTFQHYFKQKRINNRKENTSNITYLYNSLKCYLESSPLSGHPYTLKSNFVAEESCHMRRKLLGDVMTTLSLPPSNIVIAPVTKLNDYFESMSCPDTSDIDVSLNIEILRIEGFRNFPRSAEVSTIRLAENGFFYTGESDEVECFNCHVRYSGWKRGDIPSHIHKQISPNCDFARGKETTNVPLLPSSSTNRGNDMASERFHTRGPPDLPEGRKIRDHQLRFEERSQEVRKDIRSFDSTAHSTANENGYHSNGNVEVSHKKASASNIYNEVHAIQPYLDNNSSRHNDWMSKYSGKLKLPPLAYVKKAMIYPAYAIPTIRLSSYSGWSSTSGLLPKSLADAGFLYAGYGDLVRCFCCGGALRNWMPGDDPWIEHARWFPECVYLRRSKGDSFIMLVHDDVNLTEVVHHENNVPLATSNTDFPQISEPPSTHSQDVASQDPFIQRVKEMGFPMDIISSALSSLRRQSKPVDVYNIVNVILYSETPFLRDGFDEVDNCIHRQQMAQKKTRQVCAEKRCKICLEEDACVIFLPCHHMTCCEECGSILHKCQVCRQAISGRLKFS